MIRRFSIVVCALLGAASLTSCSQFDRNDLAASANGVELSQDELGEMLNSELGADLLNVTPENGFITGDGARGLISAWIGLTVIEQAGIAADADRDQIAADLESQFGTVWTEAPQTMKDLAVTNVAVGTMVQSGELAQEEVLTVFASADVFVDSRYGAWDAENVSVVALG